MAEAPGRPKACLPSIRNQRFGTVARAIVRHVFVQGGDMLKNLSVKKAFTLFGASSALICCVAFNMVSGGSNWPVQIGVSLLLLAGGALTGHFIGRFYGSRAEIIVGGLHALAKGRLDHRISLDGKDDFAWLGYEYNSARKAVKQLVERLQALSTTLTGSAVELSQASGEARETVTRQLDSIRAVGSAIEQMSGKIQDLESLSREASDLSQAAGSASQAGKRTLEGALDSVHAASGKMADSLAVIERLVDDSRAINRINELIKELSDQTNLLALNAAIEAARAGEQGRGFAVVADEVRKLAQRSQASSNDISELVVRIRDDAEETITLVRGSNDEVTVATQNTAAAVSEFDGILQRLQALSGKSATISDSLGAQNASAGEIVRNTELLFSLSEQNAKVAEETARQGTELASSAQNLQEAVQVFRI
jgi:methyl-accepting chemotaxis protein